jgi:hypothetical protein
MTKCRDNEKPAISISCHVIRGHTKHLLRSRLTNTNLLAYFHDTLVFVDSVCVKAVLNQLKEEAQTASFKDPVRTAL